MLLVICALNGCHHPAPPVELTTQEIALSNAGEYEILFDACLDTLRDHRFKLDRVDRHEGTITTFPVTSQQFFEFWRNDVYTAYDLVEASLLTIRRRVEIRLLGQGSPLHKKLVITVHRERFSTPDRQYNTSAAAFRVYSRSLPSTSGEIVVPKRDDVWLEAGRDGIAEQRLINEITERVFARNRQQAGEADHSASNAGDRG